MPPATVKLAVTVDNQGDRSLPKPSFAPTSMNSEPTTLSAERSPPRRNRRSNIARRRQRRRRSAGDRRQPEALGSRRAQPLSRPHHDLRGRQGRGPVRHAVRHPHARVYRARRLQAQRQARRGPGHLQPPRPRRARRGAEHPGAGAAAWKSSRRWAATRCAPRTTRPRPNCWTWPTRWGSWSGTRPSTAGPTGKKANDYNRLFKEWHVKDLQALVRRDRNHPSVFIWSHRQRGDGAARTRR